MATVTWLCARCKMLYTEPRERCPNDGWHLIENWSGRTFAGRWQIERLIGVGAGGTSVWQAVAIETGRPAAVKLQPARDPKEMQRFERGARISAMLEHRHMTRVVEHGREGDSFFLVMELLEGETLQRRIARLKTMPAVEVAHVADQILEALGHAHQQRVVHRDIKPANVFITPMPDDPLYVRVLDFGIAKWVEGGDRVDDSRVGRLDLDAADAPLAVEHPEVEVTQAQQILGTPEYMAPEQIIGAPADVRSDLYAVGILMYRMLAGRLPFEAKSRFEMYHRHLNDPPPPFPPELKVPPALDAVIRRALEKRIADRWRDAASMRRALRAAVGLTSPMSLPEGESTEGPRSALIPAAHGAPKRKSAAGLWLAVGGAVAAGAVAAVLLLGGDGASVEGLERATVAANPGPEAHAAGVGRETADGSARVANVGAGEAAPKVAGAPSGGAQGKGPAVAGGAPAPSEIEGSPSAEPAAVPSKIEGSPSAEPAAVPSKIEGSPNAEPGPDPSKIETPEPAPAVAKARFTLSSEPAGAEVWRGAEKLGVTPLTLELERSELPIDVELRRAGHRPKKHTLAATEAAEQAISVELARIRAVARPSTPQGPPQDIHLER